MKKLSPPLKKNVHHFFNPWWTYDHHRKISFAGTESNQFTFFMITKNRGKNVKNWKSSERIGIEINSFTFRFGIFPHFMP